MEDEDKMLHLQQAEIAKILKNHFRKGIREDNTPLLNLSEINNLYFEKGIMDVEVQWSPHMW